MKKQNHILLLTTIFILCCCSKENSNEDIVVTGLEENFLNPPQEARPRTWMHAMSGNMTKEGLTKDLESMAEVGLGGLLLFNITQGIPNGPVKYNSSEHHEMIAHAAKEAERLGLSFGLHNCDGWSASGGPWITPEDSMKMIVWSETQIQGGKEVEINLDQPTTRENFYKDIAVIAYPSLASELDDQKNTPSITSSDPGLDISIISDRKKDRESVLTKKGTNDPWIQYSYKQPKTIRSASLIFNERHAVATLQTSDDGTVFKDVRELFKVRTSKMEWAVNDHFEGITSKYFRVKIANRNNTTTLKEVELSASYCLNNILGRTAIARTEDHALDDIGNPDPTMIIPKNRITNISADMNENGRLQTNLPEGNWTILRFGYTSTGAFNHPASDEGRGLEVDKLKRSSFKKHYDAFIKKVVAKSKPIAPNALQYVEIDSYEMGGQNWTEGFDMLFEERNGYDIKDFLPLIAGRFVDSPETSDAILWDYRKQICDMMTWNYFQYFTELCHEDGLQSYIEPYGFGPLNDLDVGGTADIPMGEFWMNRPVTMAKSAISAAHIYGKPVISAESFTSQPEINWAGHPAMTKSSGDLAWTLGINEFMFHRFAHQANTHVEPGMTMNRWGFHFDRTQTWWKNAGAHWFNYIARGSYLLRQGNPVSDILVFVGDGAPNSSYRRDQLDPEIPKTINFDCVNADVLLNRIEVQENTMLLPEGTRYKILILKNTAKLTLKTVKKIVELSEQGIKMYGEKPIALAGYGHSKEDIQEFDRLAKKLNAVIGTTLEWSVILKENAILPDFEIVGRNDITFTHRKTKQEDIYFFFNPDSIANTFSTNFRIPNKIPELWNPMNGSIKKAGQFSNQGQITKVSIPLEARESVFVVFRKSSEKIKSVIKNSSPKVEFFLNDQEKLQAMVKGNGTYEAALSDASIWKNVTDNLPQPFDVLGKWKVTFNKKGSYEKTVVFDSLIDWKEHPRDSIQYYSGTATYQKTIHLPEEYIGDDKKTILDLGDVRIVAEVFVNGKSVDTLWIPPFTTDIAKFVKPGTNDLKIRITNQWSNKLIGDQRFPANDGGYKLGPHRATDLTMPEWYTKNQPLPSGKRTTFTTASFYRKEDPLRSSGLLGPVRVYNYQISNVQ